MMEYGCEQMRYSEERKKLYILVPLVALFPHLFYKGPTNYVASPVSSPDV